MDIYNSSHTIYKQQLEVEFHQTTQTERYYSVYNMNCYLQTKLYICKILSLQGRDSAQNKNLHLPPPSHKAVFNTDIRSKKV